MIIWGILCVVLGVSTSLAAWVPSRAQEPIEPPGAAGPEPKADGSRIGVGPQGTLDELTARRLTAVHELLLLEAQLAVKKAEVQKIDAEIRLFQAQHPDAAAIPEAIKSDPEVASLISQIESATRRQAQVTHLSRFREDPSRVAADRALRSLQDRLRDLVDSKRASLERDQVLRSIPEPPGGSVTGGVERKLERLIMEVESLRRSLSEDRYNP